MGCGERLWQETIKLGVVGEAIIKYLQHGTFRGGEKWDYHCSGIYEVVAKQVGGTNWIPRFTIESISSQDRYYH